MTEPTTTAAATGGILSMIGSGFLWLAGSIGLVTAGKIIIDYINMRGDVKTVKDDNKEMKKENKEQFSQLNAKLDKVLSVAEKNGTRIAVLEERTKK